MRKTIFALAMTILSLNSMNALPIVDRLYEAGDMILHSDRRIREKEEFLESVINNTLSKEGLSQMYVVKTHSAVNGVCVNRVLAKRAEKKTEEFPVWLFELQKVESEENLIDIVNNSEVAAKSFMGRYSGVKRRELKDFQSETIKSSPNHVITYHTLTVSNSETELELGMISDTTKYENWMLIRDYLFDLNENGPSRSEIIAKNESNRSVQEWASRCEEYMTTTSQHQHSSSREGNRASR